MDGDQFFRAIRSTPAIEFQLDAASAFILVGLIQLAIRHPNIPTHSAAVGHDIVRGIQSRMPGEVQELIEKGFDPAFDVSNIPA